MKIHKILNIKIEQYNNIILYTKMDWMEAFNPTRQELQLAMLNQRLHNYFDFNYKELEHQFINYITFIDKPKTNAEMIDLYSDFTGEIYKSLPYSLKVNIKAKQKIVEPSFN